MSIYSEKLNSLLETVKKFLGDIPEDIEKVFLNTPRHLFVDKLYDRNEAGEVIEVEITEENIEQYLDVIYGNNVISLIAEYKKKSTSSGSQWILEKGISSISQPTLVLLMLKHLNIEKGQNILEIGAASGWNAVMMGKLTGDEGHVYSIEIVPDLAVSAKKRIERQNIKNVSIIEGDGAFGVENKSFDRIVFTVGSYDIPKGIYSQLKDNGLLLMVLKVCGFNDCLLLLKKSGDHLESISNSPCGFVSLTGQYAMTELDPANLESLNIWKELKDQVVHEQAFWWGTNSKRNSWRKISGITSFLAIVEPEFKMFKGEEEYTLFFGLIAEEDNSIVLWKNNKLTGYGNKKALQKIRAAFELYLELGMPSAHCFNVKVYPIDQEIELGKNQWLIKRKDSQFVWSLKQFVDS